MGVATDPRLYTNRFCGVGQPFRVQPLASGIQEQGTELCPDSLPSRDRHVPGEYGTIQAAVDAAGFGDTIHIGAGDYYEQIVIANKLPLTLRGEPGAVIHAASGMTETLRPYDGWLWFSLLGIFRSDVVVSNLTFDGEHLGEAYTNSVTGVSSGLIGILHLGSGGRVENCTLRGFRGATLSTSAGAIAIYTDNSLRIGSPAVHLDVLKSTFTDNELSITVRGDPVNNPSLLRATFTVEGNSVTGLGPAAIAIDGIAIHNGVTGVVRNNTIGDHLFTGIGDSFASGIAAHDGRGSLRTPFAFVPLFPVRYEGNTFTNNDEHLVIIAGDGSEVINNVFHGGGPDLPRWGGLALSGANITVANNDFSEMPTGIVLFGDDHFFTGWPRIAPAPNPKLLANWFCNVPEPIRVDTNLVSGLQEQGTEQCETGATRPVFRSIVHSDGAGTALTVRGWHGDSLVIEASTNLSTNQADWIPVHTNTMGLPILECQDTNGVGAPHRFYRAVRP
jgi:hypothetical protein